MIDPNGDYELKVTTGESRYIFETSVKENTGGKSSYFSPFVREKEGSEHLLSSSVRPYRLFAETDGDAMVTISGVGTGGERLEHSFLCRRSLRSRALREKQWISSACMSRTWFCLSI